jgi:hypothetical protein
MQRVKLSKCVVVARLGANQYIGIGWIDRRYWPDAQRSWSAGLVAAVSRFNFLVGGKCEV